MYISKYTHIYVYFETYTYIYSISQLEYHVSNLKFESMIYFSKSFWPRSVGKRRMRLRLEIKIERHSKCNRLYIYVHTQRTLKPELVAVE